MTQAETTETMADAPKHSPWHDEFERPSEGPLIEGLGESEAEAFGGVLDELRAGRGVKSRIEWLGLPWRWTIVLTRAEIERPAWAYLVARPGGTLLCVPVPVAFFETEASGGLTKAVRARVDRAPIVAGFLWCEWSVPEVDLVALRPILEARLGGGDG